MISTVAGTLMYSLVASTPIGWIQVHPDMCKRAYGMNFDGYIISQDGQRQVVRGYCYKKI